MSKRRMCVSHMYIYIFTYIYIDVYVYVNVSTCVRVCVIVFVCAHFILYTNMREFHILYKQVYSY